MSIPINWKVGDVVELAGRRGKIESTCIGDNGMLTGFDVSWNDSDGYSTNVNLSAFPEAKRIEPEPTCTRAFAEALKANEQWKIVGRFSDIRAGGITEAICPHGIGHHRGRHGCDGCCGTPEAKTYMEQTTNEEDGTMPDDSVARLTGHKNRVIKTSKGENKARPFGWIDAPIPKLCDELYLLEKKLRKDFGDPCAKYDHSCVSCQVWGAFIVLAERMAE